ncbi:hypothetical protein DFH27DRAFT_547026 [Peziza echinospora]|nr:hypothetical protein DFH27DRAFT_547026 [Peziza echinospora]
MFSTLSKKQGIASATAPAASPSPSKKPSSKSTKEKKRKRTSTGGAAEDTPIDLTTTTTSAAPPTPTPTLAKKPRTQEPSASALLTSSTSPFTKATAHLYLPISPIYSPHPWYSIETDHLDPLILTYYPPLKGIILSYQNLRFLERGAALTADTPFAHTWVSVDFLLYQPKRGATLEGCVNLQSQSHIGLLVLNTFNASVPREKIPKGWRWCEKRPGFVGRMVKAVRMVRRRKSKAVSDEAGDAESGDADAMEGVQPTHPEQKDAEAEPENPQEEEDENEQDFEEVEEEFEEEEEDMGGWVDEFGSIVDGMLSFTVDSVRASGHIVAIEGSLLTGLHTAHEDEAPAAAVIALPLRPVEKEVVEIQPPAEEEEEAPPVTPSPKKRREKKEKKEKKKTKD